MGALSIRVIPNAARASVVGWQPDGTLKVKVCAPPEGGRANEAVVELLADSLGLSRRAVRIVSGETARNKRVEVEGLDAAALKAKWC